MRSTPLLTPDGEVQLVVNVFRDITKERHEEERMHFLGEASTLLAASLDYEATLADLAKLLVPRVADYCIVDALDEDGALASGRDLAPRPGARGAAARGATPLSAGEERGASGLGGAQERRALSRRGRAPGGALPDGGRRGAPRALPRTRSDLVHRRPARGARAAARDDLARHGRVATALRRGRPRARARDRAPSGARDRQRAPLRHRAAVVRAAQHAARLGARRDRLLGSGAPLHPRERGARRDQRAHSRGARREAAGRRDRRAQPRSRAALPPCAGVG